VRVKIEFDGAVPEGAETCRITNADTGEELAVKKLLVKLEAGAMPVIRLDLFADKLHMAMNAEADLDLSRDDLEKIARKHGFRLVADDGLDVELGRSPSET